MLALWLCSSTAGLSMRMLTNRSTATMMTTKRMRKTKIRLINLAEVWYFAVDLQLAIVDAFLLDALGMALLLVGHLCHQQLNTCGDNFHCYSLVFN